MLERTVVAEHYFWIIFTLDRAEDYGDGRKVDDDPFDERNWIKATPLLGVAVQLAELRRRAPPEYAALKPHRRRAPFVVSSSWLPRSNRGDNADDNPRY